MDQNQADRSRRLATIFHYLERHTRLGLLLVAVIAAGYFSWLQATPTFGDPDAFYHLEMAKLMSSHLVTRDFPWLQATFLAHNFVDQHFLYHAYLIPFIRLFPDWIGVKVAQTVLDVGLLVLFYAVLRGLRVKGAAWLTLLLLFSESFIYRVGLVKAQPLALMLLLGGLYALIKNKNWWLLPLAWLYVWTYGGWFMLIVVTVVWVAVKTWMKTSVLQPAMSRGWLGRLLHRTVTFFRTLWRWQNCRPLLIIMVGVVMGLVSSPYFPHNLHFYWIQIIQTGFVSLHTAVHVGAEWYPYEPLELVNNAILPFILILLSAVGFGFYRKKMDATTAFLFMLTLLFFVATLKSRRNIEYFIPIGVFFSAIFITAVSRLPEAREIKPRFKLSKKVITVIFILVLSSAVYSVRNASVWLRHGYPITYGATAAKFLQSRAQPGQIVFNVSWDMFPLLFYHDQRQYYLTGLDPTFTYAESPALYRLWYDISSGQGQDKLAAITTTFHARYVWVDRPDSADHQTLMRQLGQSTLMKMIYHDREAALFQML